jgi:hypothetical protein
VRGARGVAHVVDVHRVDPDERGAGVPQERGTVLREEGMLVRAVALRPEVLVLARTQKDRVTSDVEAGEARGVDAAIPCDRRVYDEGRSSRQRPQLLVGEVDAFRVAVEGHVDVGAGVRDELDASDLELRTLRVVRAALLAREEVADDRSWQPGVGRHPVRNDVAQVDEHGLSLIVGIRGAARERVGYGRSMTVRVRFAPSPTGSLHLGNALTAVANRRFADERDGAFLLRIDDTDASRSVEGGEKAILADLVWLGVAWDEGPIRQSVRGALYAEAAERALGSGAAERDPEGAVRLARDGTTLLRPDGTATYQLASVADDLDLGITHVIRGSDHRPNLGLHQRIARALGGELPEVIHHGLVLGPDGKKLSKRHGHSSIVELRDAGLPAPAVRAYLEELDLPEHDVQLDLARLGRLAIDAIAAMTDDELAAAAGAPVEAVPALRGARTLLEARAYGSQVVSPEPAELPPDAGQTLVRFTELRLPGPERLSPDEARALLRELKAVGGDLKALRLALTGADRGPELWAVLAALPRDEALSRATVA